MQRILINLAIMAVLITGAVLAFEFGLGWLTLILILASLIPGFKFDEAFKQRMKEKDVFCQMKSFLVEVHIEGTETAISSDCPYGAEGSGLYDIDVFAERDAHCVVFAPSEDRAKEIVLEHTEDFDDPDEGFYAKKVEVTSIAEEDYYEPDEKEDLFDIDYER